MKGAIGEIMPWIIGLVFVIIFLAVFQGLSGNLRGAEDQLLLGELPGETAEIKQELFQVDKNLETTTNSLFKAFLTQYGNENCFIEYDDTGFDDLNKKQIVFEVTSTGMKGTLLNDVGVPVMKEDFPGLKPCVVFDKNKEGADVSDVIYGMHFNPPSVRRVLKKRNGDDFFELKNVLMVEHGLPGFSEKQIQIDNINYDSETNLLYRADAKHICFIPTKDGDSSCDGDTMLDDDCFLEYEGKLKMCLGKEEAKEEYLSEFIRDIPNYMITGIQTVSEDCYLEKKIVKKDGYLYKIKNGKISVLIDNELELEVEILDLPVFGEIVFDEFFYVIYNKGVLSYTSDTKKLLGLRDCNVKKGGLLG